MPDGQLRVSTTLSAPVSPARLNTSYASSNSSRWKWWVTKRSTSSWWLWARRSSVGVEEVSTSPVLIVTFLIHNSSRCSRDGERVLAPVVDDDVGPELLGGVEAAVGEVDGDDVARAVQPGTHHHRQTDRSGTDHGDDVAGPDTAVEDADLVARRQDVGEHQQLLVGDPVGLQIGRGVGERHPHVLGLGPVDLVAKDPPATTDGTARSRPPGRTGKAPHAVMHDTSTRSPAPRVFTPVPDGLDRADRFVTEDPSRRHRRHITLEDVQIGPADRHGIDAHHRIGVIDQLRLRRRTPNAPAWCVASTSRLVNNMTIPDLHAAATGQTGSVRIEPSPRRVRVVFAGEWVADSQGALYLFEQGHLPVYYFPRRDVRHDLLEPTDRHTTARARVTPRTGASASATAGRGRRVELPRGHRRVPGHHRPRRLLLERGRRLVRGGRRGLRPRPRPVQAHRHACARRATCRSASTGARRRLAPPDPAVRDRAADALLPPPPRRARGRSSCRRRTITRCPYKGIAEVPLGAHRRADCTTTSCGRYPAPDPRDPEDRAPPLLLQRARRHRRRRRRRSNGPPAPGRSPLAPPEPTTPNLGGILTTSPSGRDPHHLLGRIPPRSIGGEIPAQIGERSRTARDVRAA